MMNLSGGSECSSGCESGWTVYFDEAAAASNYTNWAAGKGVYAATNNHEDNHIQEDDEDLSMVSDASSGPPHFQEYTNCGFQSHQYNYGYDYYYYNNSVPQGHQQKSKNKTSTTQKQNQQQKANLCLDDTASSPFFHFSKDNVVNDNHDSVENVYGFSQVYSPPHFEDESKSKKHLGFFKSSNKGKSGTFLGRKKQ